MYDVIISLNVLIGGQSLEIFDASAKLLIDYPFQKENLVHKRYKCKKINARL